ncbi:cytochrome c oxidase assembly factor CtaG [Pontibacillus yanchengensis]|uniref:Cytochrome C oxidase assembly protein n=1 Tax=Pontibacillus yanchengensis Y32 TaxID=1385514 RepID=A0A0A2TQ93_9BACI|nr:cytochrome c oxidase assembly factor CtaG [Pontibacillus yanchengensis]KGP71465.1 cytochrome C oxidase assembly protein [Pontibacillus yanchengensis Y32]
MWLELQIFGFRALWSPYYFVFICLLAGLYYVLTGPWRSKFGDVERPSSSQQIMFYTGLILLYLIKGSPVDLLGHIMFTAHMTQMALYYLVFPIFIVQGIPKWMWRKLFSTPILAPVLRILTKPLVALLLFNGLFSLYHIPEVFDFAKTSVIAHAIITTVILITAFCVWWPVFTPLEEMDTLSPLLKLGYIFANGVLITPACGLIIFAGEPLYSTYSDPAAWSSALSLCVPGGVLSSLSLGGPQIFSPMPILQDQQLGGVIMKITQEIVYGIFIAIIFFSWYNQESSSIDPIPSES